MKQTAIQIRCDSRQADALRHFMGQKGLVLEADLEGHLSELFVKHVPKNLHEYLLKKPDQTAKGK